MSLGERSASYTKDVFSAAIKIHHVLSLIIVLLAETIGFWFMNTVLTIPEDRVFAANVIYQFSIVTVFLSIASNGNISRKNGILCHIIYGKHIC